MPIRREGGPPSIAEEWEDWWWQSQQPTAVQTPYGLNYEYRGVQPDNPALAAQRAELLRQLPLPPMAKVPQFQPKAAGPKKKSTGETLLEILLNPLVTYGVGSFIGGLSGGPPGAVAGAAAAKAAKEIIK